MNKTFHINLSKSKSEKQKPTSEKGLNITKVLAPILSKQLL